ncbi:MAG: hypothetical protein P9M15_05765 [Candidatus Electryoneaceae bacterium]|nr:hypothetical protein [Candidatus Electryoneaceae bacterium]
MNSVLQLKQFNVNSLTVDTRASTEALLEPILDGYNFQIEFGFEPVEINLHVHLSLKFEWDDTIESPFKRIGIGVNGIFNCSKEPKDEQTEEQIRILCIANLYGTCRGILAQATGQCPGGPFYSPVVNMFSIVKQAEKEQTSHPELETAEGDK